MKKLLLACLILSLTGCVRGIRIPLPRMVPIKAAPVPRVVRPPAPSPVVIRQTPALAREPFPAAGRVLPEAKAATPATKAMEGNTTGHLSHFGGHLHHLLPSDDKKDRSRGER
jgi:hypothetical protein